MKVYDAEDKNLFSGVVWPNEQYEYDTEQGGEYRVCLSLTESMFLKGFSQVKTQFKFASEFHRDKKLANPGEEVHHSAKKTQEEEGGLK